jgi:hypothetical protein
VTDAVAFHSCLWDDDFISAYLDGDSIEERCPQCDNIEAAHRNLLIQLGSGASFLHDRPLYNHLYTWTTTVVAIGILCLTWIVNSRFIDKSSQEVALAVIASIMLSLFACSLVAFALKAAYTTDPNLVPDQQLVRSKGGDRAKELEEEPGHVAELILSREDDGREEHEEELPGSFLEAAKERIPWATRGRSGRLWGL